jgi:hypothetical protein
MELYLLLTLHYMLNCIQKHASGSAALASLNSDQSSLRKEVTTPSTPSANRIHFPLEQTTPNSLVSENMSVDFFSVDDEEINFGSITDKEARWVLNY